MQVLTPRVDKHGQDGEDGTAVHSWTPTPVHGAQQCCQGQGGFVLEFLEVRAYPLFPLSHILHILALSETPGVAGGGGIAVPCWGDHDTCGEQLGTRSGNTRSWPAQENTGLGAGAVPPKSSQPAKAAQGPKYSSSLPASG